MQDPHSKILQRHRLRPQKKGRLPNFTKDFEEYTERINQMIKNQIGFSFQINKYGVSMRPKMSKLKNVLSLQERKLTQKQEDSAKLISQEIKLPEKYLKYNQPRIRPDHKIKIRNKSSRKENKQNSLPIIKEIKRLKEEQVMDSGKLPRINFTARQMVDKKVSLFNIENQLEKSKSSRIHPFEMYPKEKYYKKLFHIVTMGRREVKTQI